MAKTVVKPQPVRSELPTAEEYRSLQPALAPIMLEYREPKYQCPTCDGIMCRTSMAVLLSQPVQYEYKCDKCGLVEYLRH